MSKKIYWLFAIIFFVMITADWVYIFFLAHDPLFIVPFVILIPIILPLIFIVVIVTLFGIYSSRLWGYVGAYSLIIFTIGFSIISYSVIERTVLLERSYLTGVILINILLFFAVVFLHIYAARMKNE